MRVSYSEEHTPCYNYTKCIWERFLYYESLKIEMDEEIHEANYILFVMEGKLELSCNGERIELPVGSMICCSRRNVFRIFSQGEASIVIAQFDISVQGHEKISFSQLSNPEGASERGMYPLEIKDKLPIFLKLLTGCLEDGAGCVHLHGTKLKGLFWNIRFYYTKTEQAAFSRPILGNEREFRKEVPDDHRSARIVKELAYLCGYPLSASKRSFSKEFREPASKWLRKQINSIIKYKLANKDTPIGIIADELHFPSQPQFCRYYGRNFGYIPGEWRELLKNRNRTPERFSDRM